MPQTWECLNCGKLNSLVEDREQCSQCFKGKEEALTMKILKKKRMCVECGHRHREGFYYHVYCEAADSAIEDDEEDALIETES